MCHQHHSLKVLMLLMLVGHKKENLTFAACGIFNTTNSVRHDHSRPFIVLRSMYLFQNPGKVPCIQAAPIHIGLSYRFPQLLPLPLRESLVTSGTGAKLQLIGHGDLIMTPKTPSLSFATWT